MTGAKKSGSAAVCTAVESDYSHYKAPQSKSDGSGGAENLLRGRFLTGRAVGFKRRGGDFLAGRK